MPAGAAWRGIEGRAQGASSEKRDTAARQQVQAKSPRGPTTLRGTRKPPGSSLTNCLRAPSALPSLSSTKAIAPAAEPQITPCKWPESESPRARLRRLAGAARPVATAAVMGAVESSSSRASQLGDLASCEARSAGPAPATRLRTRSCAGRAPERTLWGGGNGRAHVCTRRGLATRLEATSGSVCSPLASPRKRARGASPAPSART